MTAVRLLTLDPAHFHAALVHKEMVPGVDPRVHIYAPLGPELFAHLERLRAFNQRPTKPTKWLVDVHAGPDFRERWLAEKPGNAVVLSGRNRDKIRSIEAAIDAGLHVLADKPWVLRASDMPRLERALQSAQEKNLVVHDIMTERHEVTSILQRELVQDPALFGALEAGSPDEPAIVMESVHHLLKKVAGLALRRPAQFFEIEQQGEALADVGTHLVDLVPWIAFPEQPLDVARDLRLHSASHWPVLLGAREFQQITGEREYPPFLQKQVQGEVLSYMCNNSITYQVRDVWVSLDIAWHVKAPAGGGDTHFARFRGSLADVEIRQGKKTTDQPELFVVPRGGAALGPALKRCVQRMNKRYPGVGVTQSRRAYWITIPERYRVGHEAHFAEVTREFLRSVANPARVPAWELPNLIAKYWLTTHGVDLARKRTAGAKAT